MNHKISKFSTDPFVKGCCIYLFFHVAFMVDKFLKSMYDLIWHSFQMNYFGISLFYSIYFKVLRDIWLHYDWSIYKSATTRSMGFLLRLICCTIEASPSLLYCINAIYFFWFYYSCTIGLEHVWYLCMKVVCSKKSNMHHTVLSSVISISLQKLTSYLQTMIQTLMRLFIYGYS